jgi:hypothetical protein
MDTIIEQYFYPNRNIKVALLLNNYGKCVYNNRKNRNACKKELDKLTFELIKNRDRHHYSKSLHTPPSI